MSLEEAVRENTVALIALTNMLAANTSVSVPDEAPAKAAPAKATTAAAAPAKAAAATQQKAAAPETGGAKPTLDEAYAVAVRAVGNVAKAKGRDVALKMLQDAGCPMNAQGGYSLPRLTDTPKPSVDLLIKVCELAQGILEPAA